MERIDKVVSEKRRYVARLDDIEIEVEASGHLKARQAVVSKFKQERESSQPVSFLMARASSVLVESEGV